MNSSTCSDRNSDPSCFSAIVQHLQSLPMHERDVTMAPLFKISAGSIRNGQAADQEGMLKMLRDFLVTCRRSWAAADHYENLSSMSDKALAEQGLQRKDLARVAFDRLSEDE